MRVRSTMVVAAIVAAVATSLSGARSARAQGSVPAVGGDRVLTPAVASAPTQPPAVLGEGWARALRAVLEGMKHLVDAERIEAAEVGGPVAVARIAPSPPPSAPAWRTAWLPASALREQVAASPVQLTPVFVDPPTETPADSRGQHAVLLGVKLELPWMVP